MASLLPQLFLDTGPGLSPSDGSKLQFNVVGSSTPKDVYTDATAGTPLSNPVISNSLGVFTQIFITGSYDWVLSDKNSVQQDTGTVSEFALVSDSTTIKNFANLSLAVADTNLVDGDALNIAERTDGNGGGAMWDVVLSSSVTENTFNIVQGTGVGTLSLVLRIDNIIHADQFGLVATASGSTASAAANLTAIDLALVLLTPLGGVIEFGLGYYYFSGKVQVTISGITMRGQSVSPTSSSLGTHFATTSQTDDVILVDDSVLALEGFEFHHITIIGNADVGGASAGSCLAVRVTAGLGRAISRINIHDAAFIKGFDHGIHWEVSGGGSNFMFDNRLNNLTIRNCGGNGLFIDGKCSQNDIDKIYSESNDGDQIKIDGGTNLAKAMKLNRLTCSFTPSGQSGVNLANCHSIDIDTIYMEDTAGANITIQNVQGLNVIGGAMDQLASTSTGVLMGAAAGEVNRDITIDVPGWTRGGAATANYVDLTNVTGGQVADTLRFGATADDVLDSNDIDGFDSVSFFNSISFLYENVNASPTIQVDANAGTGATATLSVSSTSVTASTDRKGKIVLTTGSGAYAIGNQFEVTFNAPYDTPPSVTIQASNSNAANQTVAQKILITSSKTGFLFGFTVAETAARLSTWDYQVMGN